MLVRQEIQPIWFCCRVSRLTIFMTSHTMYDSSKHISVWTVLEPMNGWLGDENYCEVKSNEEEEKSNVWREAMNILNVAMSEQSRDEWIFVFLIKMYLNVLILILCCHPINAMFVSSWCKIEAKKIDTKKNCAACWQFALEARVHREYGIFKFKVVLWLQAISFSVTYISWRRLQVLCGIKSHLHVLKNVIVCFFNNSFSWVSEKIEDWFKIEFMYDMHQMWWQTETSKNEWWMEMKKNGKC